MIRVFDLVIPGNPVPKERPRSTVKNGRLIVFGSAKTKAAERNIADRARLARIPCHKGWVRLDLGFFRQDARRVDWDNLAKTVCDALNGVAYEDDSSIQSVTVHKGVDKVNPRTTVRITTWDGGDVP